MIAGLKGKIEQNSMGEIELDVHGVIYGIHTSLLTSLDLKVGDEVKFFITEIIREDAYLLFGFLKSLCISEFIIASLIASNGISGISTLSTLPLLKLTGHLIFFLI